MNINDAADNLMMDYETIQELIAEEQADSIERGITIVTATQRYKSYHCVSDIPHGSELFF